MLARFDDFCDEFIWLSYLWIKKKGRHDSIYYHGFQLEANAASPPIWQMYLIRWNRCAKYTRYISRTICGKRTAFKKKLKSMPAPFRSSLTILVQILTVSSKPSCWTMKRTLFATFQSQSLFELCFGFSIKCRKNHKTLPQSLNTWRCSM